MRVRSLSHIHTISMEVGAGKAAEKLRRVEASAWLRTSKKGALLLLGIDDQTKNGP
jgi:hypothetical protein